jgi:hypothetical protein
VAPAGQVGGARIASAVHKGGITSLRWSDLALPLSWTVGVFVIAWARPLGDSPDYRNYEAFFEWIRLVDWYSLTESRFEPGFGVLAVLLVQLFSSSEVVYALLASLAFAPKAWIFQDMDLDTAGLVVVLGFYASRFLLLHELTQLRVSFATAALMLAWVAEDRGARRAAIALGMLSVTFHYSSLIRVPLIFLRTDRKGVALGIGLGIFLATRAIIATAIGLLPPGFGPLAIYEATGFTDVTPNPLAPTVVLDWMAIGGGLLLWDRITTAMRQVLVMEIAGMGIYYGAAQFAVFAHRPREMVGVFWVFFLAQGWRCERRVQQVVLGFAILSVAMYLYLFIFRETFFS